ncbi:hypothetical protein SAMN05216482_0392 [Streptomyces sp. PAN_FS17]|nr:hypothetical protein SAMN05216482_0392 [Streptomyces sp. PAN_FS17]
MDLPWLPLSIGTRIGRGTGRQLVGRLGKNITFELDPVSGEFTFKSGVMAVVRRGGTVRPDDPILVDLPPLPHRPLERVQGCVCQSCPGRRRGQ